MRGACGLLSDVPIEFRLSPQQVAKLKAWLSEEVYPTAIARQREEAAERGDLWRRSAEHAWAEGRPYYGATGVGLSYRFKPNGVGLVVQVAEAITGQSINLTEIDNW